MKEGRNRAVWGKTALACIATLSLGYVLIKEVSAVHHPTVSANPAAVLHTAQLNFANTSFTTHNEDQEMKIPEANIEQYPFRLYQQDRYVHAYASYSEAVSEAKGLSNTSLYFKSKDKLIWASDKPLASDAQVDAPLIYQMPELQRGCEVTSLAMLLQSAGVDVDKMTLADDIIKDASPFEIIDHEIHFGNPNDGFVGDIVSFDNPGYGVYHGPIMSLAEQYLPRKIIDATGGNFDDILRFVEMGAPVWVITNMEYQTLDDDAFETWETEEGGIDITYKEHSVLITGFDEDTIYIHDPLGEEEQVNRDDFAAAWEQMGQQAISYVR
ncbi:C39 family peptidase [Paenibacillus sp. RC67]|uniref:C39 family peptidase n=1 Tax=Paenibacillus sp. RC67 TaxID=3039392 RepID=UPI0024AD8FB7|nr:C39 family peptidase [Paenibacillus sp. RC67]